MCGYVPSTNGPDDPELETSTTDSKTGVGAATSEPGASDRQFSVPGEVLASAPSERTLQNQQLDGQVLLAIDTALGSSVALGYGDAIAEVSSDDTRSHAEVIGTLVARAFELTGANPSDVTGVVCGVGPGPFTGLRTGIAAARAFATGRGVPLFPLQGHEAVAMSVLQAHSAARVRVVQDAKRRELFVTEYSGIDFFGLPVRNVDARLEVSETFDAEPGDVWPERIPAARLVQLATRRLAHGRDFESEQALYLRAPDVKPAAAVKRVSA